MRSCHLIPVVVLLSACASASQPNSATVIPDRERVAVGPSEAVELLHDAIVKESTFTATRDRVWSAVLDAHQALGIPLSAKDSAAGRVLYRSGVLVGKIAGQRASHFLDCGSTMTGERADSYQLTVAVLEIVETITATETRLKTQIEARARPMGVSGDPIYCNTTGELEKLIAGMVSARVQS